MNKFKKGDLVVHKFYFNRRGVFEKYNSSGLLSYIIAIN